MGIRGEIFSTRVQTEKRTYFINVKENRRGDLFLNLVESRKKADNSFQRNQIVVYKEDLFKFMKSLNEAAEVVLNEEVENIYNGKAESERRTFAFELKQNRRNDATLSISEQRNGLGEEMDVHTIFIYEEDMAEFIKGVNNAADFIDNHR